MRHSVLDYTFAVAKIRALEKLLFPKEVFEEAVRAGLKETLRIFAENETYGDELTHITNSQETEEVLQLQTLRLKNMISDLILDKDLLCLLQIDNLAKTCLTCKSFKSALLSDYVNYLADMHNIKTFVRLYVLGAPPEQLADHLICEGFLKRKNFIELYPQDIAVFLYRLEHVHTPNRVIDYNYFLGEAIKAAVKNKSFIALEKTINDFLVEVLLPAKFITFGPEPILAYYFARKNEISLMRMVILAKLNNLPPDLVRMRLNKVYGG
jgi:V/A-type H+-transporting ATPase subunit C